MFYQQSMITHSNVKKANFDNYELAKVIATDYCNRNVFNTIKAGNCGAGKHISLMLSWISLQEQGNQLSSLQAVNCYER